MKRFCDPLNSRTRSRFRFVMDISLVMLLMAAVAPWLTNARVTAQESPTPVHQGQPSDTPTSSDESPAPQAAPSTPPRMEGDQDPPSPDGSPQAAVQQLAKAGRVYSRAAIISIHDEINNVTRDSLTRRFEAARKEGIDLLVLDLDTPGGQVGAALDICHMIENTRDLTTVAWVHPQAHSAGSMISVACNEIVMAPSSTIGDSQVIMIGTDGVDAVPKELGPKINTPVVSRFRASARLRGYSEVLAEAFVIPEREVWWLENTQTHDREFVFADEKARRMGEPTGSEGGVVRSAARAIIGMSDPTPGPWKLVDSYVDIVSGKTINLTQPVVRSDELLEMDAGRAYAFGFNKALVSSVEDLRHRYGVATVVNMDPTWSEDLTTWLTSPYVRGFLLLIIMLGAYVEFHTPGIGVAAISALVALVLFVGAPYLTGLANVWEIVVIVLGLLLLAIEIFVIPGFGVTGIVGILLVLLGIVATFVPEEPGRTIPYFAPHLQSTLDALMVGVKTIVICMVLSIAGMIVLAKYLPRMPMLAKIIPSNPTMESVAVDDPYYGLAQVGDIGVTLGPLRPAGKARFGAVLVDVVADGEYVEPGTRVEVVERASNRVVVRSARSV